MLISTKLLREAGFHVEVQQGAFPVKDEVYIEIHFEDGRPLPPEVHRAVEDLVSPEYAGALIEGLAQRIHTIQVLEAINKTEAKAWSERKYKNKK